MKHELTARYWQAKHDALSAECERLRAERDALKAALAGLMRYYVGERNSQNVVGEAGQAADAARAALASK